MAAQDEIVELNVHISGLDISPDQLDDLTRTLQAELREMVEEVGPLSEPAPEGAMSGPEMAAAGALAISLLQTSLPQIIQFLQTWIGRGSSNRITLEKTSGKKSVKVDIPLDRPLTPKEARDLADKLMGDL